MKRRTFVTLAGLAMAAWPLAARGEERGRLRRVGMLMPFAAGDPAAQARATLFERSLKELGLSVGASFAIDHRFAAGDPARVRQYAGELVALAPDALVTVGSVALAAAKQASRSVPIVFVDVTDPLGAGLVQSLARPGGNATGFINFDYGVSGKWVELLKQIAPNVTRAAVLREATTAAGIAQFTAIEAAARPLAIALTPVGERYPADIERALAAFARGGNGGLILTVGGAGLRRDLVIALAQRHKLPAIYPERSYAADGGLIAYGPDPLDPIRRAAGYVDRILKGEKPGELPVQAPEKYELAINLKTAKALGIGVPDALRARADAVIE